jgi:plasmid stabilization system protein ParE
MASRRRIAWTLEAERTLVEVLEYIDRDSPASARSLLSHALAASRSLSTLAERGRIVPEYGDPAVREIFVHRHRLMYRVTGEVVYILAFIHGARDFERWRSGE